MGRVEVTGLVLVVADGELAAFAVGEWLGVPAVLGGLNVATESIAPATRHTARMLASSGMTRPAPAERAGQPLQPVAAPPGAQLPVVGEHVAVELTRVIRDLDVERRLVPP